MILDPLEILAEAQRRANADTGPGFRWVLASALITHVRWYLQHGQPAAGKSLAGGVDLGRSPSTLPPIGGYCSMLGPGPE